jgi:hypothetical protein
MKMRKAMLLLAVVWFVMFLTPLSAVAQTKFSGILECGKPEPTYSINIPDREGYSLAIGQNKCIWTKPFAIEGLASKSNVQTESDEVMGDTTKNIAYGFTVFSNGDKAYHKGTGLSNQKTSSSKWEFSGGTGKLRGLKGSGTSACKPKGTDWETGYICEIQGEYTLPAAKK